MTPPNYKGGVNVKPRTAPTQSGTGVSVDNMVNRAFEWANKNATAFHILGHDECTPDCVIRKQLQESE